MVRSVRPFAAALLLTFAGTSAWAQRPLILTTPAPGIPVAPATFAGPEPTPAGLPAAPQPGFAPMPTISPAPTVSEEIPMPAASSSVPVPMVAPAPVPAGMPTPQAACCGATAAVAACCPASPAPCAAAAPVATCGCAVGGAASFAALAPTALYPGGPNSSCCGGAAGGGSMGLIDNTRFYGVGSYGPTSYASPYGIPGQVVSFPNLSPNALYAGGYANGGYGAAVSGAWPTHYGDFAGASAAAGFPMGIGYGGTAGEHIRNPYYSDRRPWYSPGPGARTVSIVW
ncbi:hypothetical protein [Planctomyces sp. SH-PL14]|uniref:hypothetical protein n=1 Tax=Planctomyces sp. SH-PL14 TaxID=1632864 RepID=UPI00078C6268|nr:hypothetical protein [Planctomyces sp. SH-PL14]AMV19278.1 hypothetical protein VT03_15410 [Planctomyces sp. SH-PL14]